MHINAENIFVGLAVKVIMKTLFSIYFWIFEIMWMILIVLWVLCTKLLFIIPWITHSYGKDWFMISASCQTVTTWNDTTQFFHHVSSTIIGAHISRHIAERSLPHLASTNMFQAEHHLRKMKLDILLSIIMFIFVSWFLSDA